MADRVLAGRYELASLVGRGGMGEVWAGHDRVIGRRVAVKLLPHQRGGGGGAQLFFREARTAGRLNHRGVVTVFDMGEDATDGTLYLVMEFISGHDLAALLRRDGPPPVHRAVEWAAGTAAALAAAHAADVVHRDLKPGNLMLTTDDEIKVLDFGIARFMAATTKSSQVMGTLAYMPPERFAEHPGDARSDLYALGCVLHELLTGHTPFESGGPVAMMTAHLGTPPTPPGRHRADIPAALDDLVLRLLAKDPADRPATAAEVHDALRAFGRPALPAPTVADPPRRAADPAERPEPPAPHALPTRTALAPPPAPTPRPPSRRRALWLGGGAVAAAGAGVAALLRFGDRPGDGGTGPGAAGTGSDSPAAGPGWTTALNSVLPTAPLMVEGVLHVVDLDGLHAVEPSNGEKLGTAPLEQAGSLAASGPRVFVGCADGTVYGFRRTAVADWQFASGSDRGTTVRAHEGTVCLVTDGVLYCLDAATGDRRWESARDWRDHTMTVTADTVLLSAWDDQLYALDLDDGDTRWTRPSDGFLSGPPAVDASQGVLYLVDGGRVVALGLDDGAERWASPVQDEGTESPSPAVLAGDTVYVGGGDRLVYALNAADGERKWAAGDRPGTIPAVADGRVLVADRAEYSPTVLALDAGDGSELWNARPGEQVGFTVDGNHPVVHDDLVYVATATHLLALDTATGTYPA
ncbi:serine/threonine-protein kinase [Streptomyces sp. NBRC 109706]|uniref:serine/threonine-protein kinase n=1 Tax=Streptomyces sp. NBRC 109706 TaxID=1550035 RepID=UPI00078217F0|nr:serine/threonine-protein kinase [Streptomyces sp. NBRC 109706]